MDIKESIKKILVNETEELSGGMIDGFDPSELIKKINELLGVDAGVKASVVAGRRSGYTVKVSSDNFVEACGPMKNCFSKVSVSEFGGSIKPQDGSFVAWVPVSIAWESLRGGTNGSDFLTAWYNFDTNAWTFETAKQAYTPRGE